MTAMASAAPPDDPQSRKVYEHNYQWLAPQPTNFIATNIRGENDQQYPQRRQGLQTVNSSQSANLGDDNGVDLSTFD